MSTMIDRHPDAFESDVHEQLLAGSIVRYMDSKSRETKVDKAEAKESVQVFRLRSQLWRMTVLYHQACEHKGDIDHCENPYCQESVKQVGRL